MGLDDQKPLKSTFRDTTSNESSARATLQDSPILKTIETTLKQLEPTLHQLLEQAVITSSGRNHKLARDKFLYGLAKRGETVLEVPTLQTRFDVESMLRKFEVKDPDHTLARGISKYVASKDPAARDDELKEALQQPRRLSEKDKRLIEETRDIIKQIDDALEEARKSGKWNKSTQPRPN